MTKTRHKRTAVASMFQNGISRNTKCAKRDGFHREGHILLLLASYVYSVLLLYSYLIFLSRSHTFTIIEIVSPIRSNTSNVERTAITPVLLH